MTLRFAFGSCRPSASASFQPPAYHAQLTPFAESVSPIVFSLSGGTGWSASSARSRLAPAAGGGPPGWDGGRGGVPRGAAGGPRPPESFPRPPPTPGGGGGVFFLGFLFPQLGGPPPRAPG